MARRHIGSLVELSINATYALDMPVPLRDVMVVRVSGLTISAGLHL